MSYPKRLLRLTPTRGFVSDTPAHEVGPDFWTGADNVLFRDGFPHRLPGSRSAYTTALATAAPTEIVHGSSGQSIPVVQCPAEWCADCFQ